jgi:plastocyanin
MGGPDGCYYREDEARVCDHRPVRVPARRGEGAQEPAPRPETPRETGGSAVTIEAFAFAPQELTVAAGTTVTWTNRDQVPHNLRFDLYPVSGGNFFESGPIDPGETSSQKFVGSNRFAYHCTYHPNMTGFITITGAG